MAQRSRSKKGRATTVTGTSMATVSLPSTVQFHYIFPETYNPEYTNGVYGGVSAQGDLAIHFYHERSAIPYKVTHDIVDGQLGPERAREPSSEPLQMVRFVTTGVVMNYDAAKRLHDWLGDKLSMMAAMAEITK